MFDRTGVNSHTNSSIHTLIWSNIYPSSDMLFIFYFLKKTAFHATKANMMKVIHTIWRLKIIIWALKRTSSPNKRMCHRFDISTNLSNLNPSKQVTCILNNVHMFYMYYKYCIFRFKYVFPLILNVEDQIYRDL